MGTMWEPSWGCWEGKMRSYIQCSRGVLDLKSSADARYCGYCSVSWVALNSVCISQSVNFFLWKKRIVLYGILTHYHRKYIQPLGWINSHYGPRCFPNKCLRVITERICAARPGDWGRRMTSSKVHELQHEFKASLGNSAGSCLRKWNKDRRQGSLTDLVLSMHKAKAHVSVSKQLHMFSYV